MLRLSKRHESGHSNVLTWIFPCIIQQTEDCVHLQSARQFSIGQPRMRHLRDELLQQAPANDLQHVSSPCSGNYISPSSKGHYIDKALGKDRYRELMRVARQWRQLKTMKWHGFGHRSNAPNAGDLALFCPTCPQPGINISLSGNETLDE